ncbi:MAG TPA: GYD domain-containing protein [Actinomycetota bacterium]|nr:GYD domain-containing protein [Actinomycetota bacterium]
MAKYLWRGSYTELGLKGLREDGGSRRRESVSKLAESLGGKLEAFYFAFGEDDLYLIYEMPDNVSATAGALIVGAPGAVRGATIPLVTPEEVDEAVKRIGEYRPPGGGTQG